MIALVLNLVFAHSGGTDIYGCHSGSQPYHCHGGGISLPSYDISTSVDVKITSSTHLAQCNLDRDMYYKYWVESDEFRKEVQNLLAETHSKLVTEQNANEPLRAEIKYLKSKLSNSESNLQMYMEYYQKNEAEKNRLLQLKLKKEREDAAKRKDIVTRYIGPTAFILFVGGTILYIVNENNN